MVMLAAAVRDSAYCRRCDWWASTDSEFGPIVQLQIHARHHHRRCPYCGAVMNGARCPRCDARYSLAEVVS